MRLALLAALLAVTLAASAQSRDRTLTVTPKETVAGEARHALVIGNSAYASAPLRNPVNDARAMAKALGEAGFSVVLLEDGTQAAMQRAIRHFGDQIAKGGVGLFYYAGHGIQAKGRNYLIPVNAEIAREDEIEFDSVDVNLVLAKMDSAKNALNIVVLDACRNNPFARAFRSSQAGLAQMDAPTGTFIAFATAPGSVAADGAGENGVYTKYLLAEMAKPGVQIEQVFKQVRNGVMGESKGQQIPWESSSLRGDFFFRAPQAAAAQPLSSEMLAELLRKEREAQQREMEKLIQAALERQRKQFEEQGFKPPAAPAPSASPPPAPAKAAPAKAPPAAATASVAPAPPAPAPSAHGLPRQGDTWTYRLTERKGTDGPQQKTYTVRVAGSSSAGILDQFSIQGGHSGEWVHSKGSYLAPLGAPLFSPYLPLFEATAPGTRLGRVVVNEPACTGNYQCHATAEVAAREVVTVPAGTFECIKIVVEQLWSGTHASMQAWGLHGGRELTVWYAPQVKRAVKFSSRLTGGSFPPIDADFDLELVNYRLQ